MPLYVGTVQTRGGCSQAFDGAGEENDRAWPVGNCPRVLSIFHNRRRRHSAIGWLTPIEFEDQTSITVA